MVSCSTADEFKDPLETNGDIFRNWTMSKFRCKWKSHGLDMMKLLNVCLSKTNEHAQCRRIRTSVNTPIWFSECLEDKFLSRACEAKMKWPEIFGPCRRCHPVSIILIHLQHFTPFIISRSKPNRMGVSGLKRLSRQTQRIDEWFMFTDWTQLLDQTSRSFLLFVRPGGFPVVWRRAMYPTQKWRIYVTPLWWKGRQKYEI